MGHWTAHGDRPPRQPARGRGRSALLQELSRRRRTPGAAAHTCRLPDDICQAAAALARHRRRGPGW